ncbi:hypothetical protein SAMN02910317_03004 [Ruminococcaceae bacterium FB2012]|nr:hypothetical protein SAMN02910317_03004 [Ruminococcaceae bacterium FB2012]
MDEKRIEAALKALGENTPRAPEKTVNDMVKTVKALNARKHPQTQAVKNEPAAEAQKTAEASKKTDPMKKR